MPAAPAELLAEQAHDGMRLDAFLHAHGLSRRDARALCELGAVAVDGVRAGASQRLRAGDAVSFSPSCREASMRLRLPVLSFDPDFIVVDKPPHLAVHAGPLVDDSVVARLQRAYAGAGLAHRLDRGASGLLLIGRSSESLRLLAASMERGAIEREYLAIVTGVVAADAFTVDLPLRATDEPRGDQPKVVVDREHGLPACTHVRVRARKNDATLLSVRLATGRTHQVRAHCAAVGHPLLGDPRYGDAAANARAHATFGIDRVLLHSARLAFPHPRTGDQQVVTAPVPADFARVFRALRQPSPR